MCTTDFNNPVFLERLRSGEQAAYRLLIRRFHKSLVSVASAIIGSHAQAEEVIQDTWLAVLSGIGRFEGRSSLATWLFSIAVNRARTRIARERRSVALPACLGGGVPGEHVPDTKHFGADGQWIDAPRLWDELNPERIVGDRQLWEHAWNAVEALPPGQRAVIVMRDIENRSPVEVCELLVISPENQRVLLHRARVRIRDTIDALIGETATAPVASARSLHRSARETPSGLPALAGH